MTSTQTVYNFRQPVRGIFRCANYDYMTEDERRRFYDKHGIRTVLDLRNFLEPYYARQYDFSTVSTAHAQQLKITDTLRTKSGPEVQYQTIRGSGTKLVRINYIDVEYRNKAIWNVCTRRQRLYLMWLILTAQVKRLVYKVNEYAVRSFGLSGMYINFCRYAGDEIAEALKLFADGGNYPIQVNCALGKDRTGLTIAFVLFILGWSIEDILDDFTKSTEGLAPIMQSVINEFVDQGLNETFASADKQVLYRTFEFLQLNYGGLTEYLDDIGIDQTVREQIVKAHTWYVNARTSNSVLNSVEQSTEQVE